MEITNNIVKEIHPLKVMIFAAFTLLVCTTGCAPKNDDINCLPSQYVMMNDSIQVHYKAWGSGTKTVMFVHGFGCNMNAWESQFDALKGEQDLRLLFIDLPGYGQSSKPRVDYTLSFFSQAVSSVLDDVNCSYAFLVGHSLGTPVCRQTLMECPWRIAGLMDIDGVYCLYPKLSDNPSEEELATSKAYEEAVQGFASSFDGEACRDNIVGFVQSLAGPNTPAEITDYALGCMPETPEYVASSTMHNLIDRKWWTDFPIPFATEIICTQNSGLEPDNRDKMQALYPAMQYTELETCGHFIQMEQAGLVNDCLHRLIDNSIKMNMECYEFGIKEIEQNYAGFEFKVTDENRAEYEQIKQEYHDSIAMGMMYGPVGVAEMCCYMQDYHLGCSFRMWSNRFPMHWANYGLEMQKYAPEPVAEKIDEETFLLRFPTCMGDDAYVKWTWDAVDQYRKSGCTHLIVDIRGNGGGSDWQYYPIKRILYGQPGKTQGIMLRNSPDNRERWNQFGPESEWIKALQDSATVHADEPWFAIGDEYETHEEDSVDPRRPEKAAIIIDHSVASSGEQLLLDVRAVAPDVKFYGRDNSLGCIDISNCVVVELPHYPNRMQIPTTASRRLILGEKLIDGVGIEPDVRLDLPLPDSLTSNIDDWVRFVAEELKK